MVSHILIVVSFEDEATRQSCLPSTLSLVIHDIPYKCNGSHASAVIHFECPRRASPFVFPVTGSHNRNYVRLIESECTVLSMLPVAMT
jgi:hypothetical protein